MSNLPDKVMVIKILNEVRRMEEHSEHFNKEIGNIKKESTRAKGHNSVSDKYTGGNQQQIR